MLGCPVPGARGEQHPTGSCTNGVLVLGEAMGDAEADEGRGFVESAPAGSVLERAIKRCGFNREQFCIWNVVPVQPPNNYLEGAPYENEAIAWGLQYVREVIARFHPSVILALGNVALKASTGLTGILENRGYPIASTALGLPVVASLHPAYLRRGAMAYLSVLMHDIRFAVAYAAALRYTSQWSPQTPTGASFPQSGVYTDTRPTSCTKVEFWSPVLWRNVSYDIPQPLPSLNEPLAPQGYVCHPTETDALAFEGSVMSSEGTMLAYDIETPYVKGEENDPESAAITSIQFSLAPASGIFMPWRDPFIPVARRILASRNPKVGANNWRFDRPLLAANDCAIGGRDYDVRWMWKHFQPDLSGALAFIASFYCPEVAPWKHLDRSHPAVYGIRDVDVLQRIL